MHPKCSSILRLFFFCLYLSTVEGQETMKVLESTVKAGEFGVISGARLSKGSVVGDSTILEGFTICARFKLRIMGSFVNGNDNRADILFLKHGNSILRQSSNHDGIG